jgi:hypothetical protein
VIRYCFKVLNFNRENPLHFNHTNRWLFTLASPLASRRKSLAVVCLCFNTGAGYASVALRIVKRIIVISHDELDALACARCPHGCVCR